MGTGIGLATFKHYVPFLENPQSFGSNFEDKWPIAGGAIVLAILLAYIVYLIIVLIKSTTYQQRLEMPISWLVGFIFGIGLVTSGM